MIARIWHAERRLLRKMTILHFLQDTGIPDYQKTQANLGVTVLRRITKDEAHFLLITLWESEEAIRRFAGEDIRGPLYAGDKDFLLEFELLSNITRFYWHISAKDKQDIQDIKDKYPFHPVHPVIIFL